MATRRIVRGHHQPMPRGRRLVAPQHRLSPGRGRPPSAFERPAQLEPDLHDLAFDALTRADMLLKTRSIPEQVIAALRSMPPGTLSSESVDGILEAIKHDISESVRQVELGYERRWKVKEACAELAYAIGDLAAVSEASPEGRAAAFRLVTVAVDALATSDSRDALWLARTLATHRSRRNWLDKVRLLLNLAAFLRAGAEPNSALTPEHCAELIERLARGLAECDARAARLTPAQIWKALDDKGKTPEGVAARLAVDCGAFDYKVYAVAKDAFRKLPSE